MQLRSETASNLLVNYAKHKKECSAALRDGHCKKRACQFHKVPINAHELEMTEIKKQSKRLDIMLGKISTNLNRMKIDR